MRSWSALSRNVLCPAQPPKSRRGRGPHPAARPRVPEPRPALGTQARRPRGPGRRRRLPAGTLERLLEKSCPSCSPCCADQAPDGPEDLSFLSPTPDVVSRPPPPRQRQKSGRLLCVVSGRCSERSGASERLGTKPESVSEFPPKRNYLRASFEKYGCGEDRLLLLICD